jgi:hypothetical protein
MDNSIVVPVSDKPLTRQEREDALAKRKRGIHMLKDPLKMQSLRDDYQDYKEFCKAEKLRLKEEEGHATDKLDRLALFTEAKNCDESIKAADAALSAIESRVDDILDSAPKSDS